MEELILKKVRGGLRGLKMGTKTIDEARVIVSGLYDGV
jgi:hypothetical protein